MAISCFIESSLVRSGVDPGKVSVIYNKPPFRPPTATEVLPLREPHWQIVAYVGQIAEHKGVHVLVESFRTLAVKFPDARLLIAGRVSQWVGDKWAHDLKEYVMNDSLLSSRVVFLGEIEQVDQLLRSALVHVAPSLWQEPLGNVIMEAKQAGCPSIVFDRGGMPELIDDGVNGAICSSMDPASLSDVIRRYLEEPSLAARQGRAAEASLPDFGINNFELAWTKAYLGCSGCESNGS